LPELLGGSTLLLTHRQVIRQAVAWLTRTKLVEDAGNVVANHLVRLARHLSIETQHVAGVQLIVQGAIKVGLMAGPLRVADPMTLVGLTVFIG
jgi:uncharacterized membrane protein